MADLIILGQKVKEIINGMEGVATGRAIYLAGCTRILVQPLAFKDGVPVDAIWIDEGLVTPVEGEIIMPTTTLTATVTVPSTGGPRTDAMRAPDPQ